MKMWRFVAVLLIIIAVVTVAVAFFYFSSTSGIGLKEGDWIMYTHYSGWPRDERDRNLTAVRLDILKINNPTVTFNLTSYLINGSIIAQTYVLNRTTEECSSNINWAHRPPYFSVARFLQPGPGVPSGNIEEDEFSWRCLNVNRTVNWIRCHGGISYPGEWGANTGYWDKQTKILIEWHFWDYETEVDSFKVNATNIW